MSDPNIGRPVTIFKWMKSPKENEEIGKGTFIGFGVSYDTHKEGMGHSTLPIIELPDGSMKMFPLKLIKFDPEPPYGAGGI